MWRIKVGGTSVADPGFPKGGRQPHRGHQLPLQLRFKNFVCQCERIWTLMGMLGEPPGSTNAHNIKKVGQSHSVREFNKGFQCYLHPGVHTKDKDTKPYFGYFQECALSKLIDYSLSLGCLVKNHLYLVNSRNTEDKGRN